MRGMFAGKGTAALAVAALALAGCATMFSGREQMVEIQVPNVKEANCAGEDKEGRRYTWFGTPTKTQVIKGDGPISVTCEAKGFKKTRFEIGEKISGALFLNVVTLGMGALVDAASGAAEPYPDVVKMPMEPVDGAPASARAEYEAAVRKVAEEIRKQREAEEEEIRRAAQ